MHSCLEKNSDRKAGKCKAVSEEVSPVRPPCWVHVCACVCVEGSCDGGLNENDNREVSCGCFVKCFEYDVKDIDLIL